VKRGPLTPHSVFLPTSRNIRVSDEGLPDAFSVNVDRDNGAKYSSSKSEPSSGLTPREVEDFASGASSREERPSSFDDVKRQAPHRKIRKRNNDEKIPEVSLQYYTTCIPCSDSDSPPPPLPLYYTFREGTCESAPRQTKITIQ
jgi:hypothetical protein